MQKFYTIALLLFKNLINILLYKLYAFVVLDAINGDVFA
jgi:hypothetical protein